MNWTNKRVIVTGAGGFIGQNLVRNLLSMCANVKAIDMNSKFMQRYSDINTSRLSFAQVNLAEYAYEFNNYVPDYIFHLAADVGGIKYLLNNQKSVFLNNAKILLNVLNEAKRCPALKGFLFMSSACVYPKVGGKLLEEDAALPASPHSSYGWSKLMGEMLVKSANIPAVSVRMTNVYGPYENFNVDHAHVIPSLIMKIVKATDEITIFGSGTQARDFIYVDDAIEGMKNAITHFTKGESVNISTGIDTTVNELIGILCELAGKDLKINTDLTQPEGEKHRSLDFTQLMRVTKWKPCIGINEGLEKMYKWAIANIEEFK